MFHVILKLSCSCSFSQLVALKQPSMSLRDRQRKNIEKILNFNGNNKTTELVWKVLVLDSVSKDILSTAVKVQDLREQGVTLHA